MKIAKKIAKILAITVAVIILLNVILFVVFSIPSVQKYAANFVLDKLEPKLKTEVHIDKVRIKFFNTVELGGLYVEDQTKDTLLYADKLAARVNVWNLLDNHLSVGSVRLEDFTAKVHQQKADAPFNFQFIIDAFASADTTKKESASPLQISINNIGLKNGNLHYNVLSEPETPGQFNVSHLSVKNFNLNADIPSLDMKNLSAKIDKLSFDEQNSGIHLEELNAKVRSKENTFFADGLKLKFNNSALKVAEAQYDTESKAFVLRAKSESVAPQDISIFTKQFSHLNKPFALDADVEGELPSLQINKLVAKYGDKTSVDIKGSLSDYSKLESADVDLKINKLKTPVEDLKALIGIAMPDFELPEQVTALKNLDLTLQAKGKLKNFDVKTTLKTDPGNISFDGKGSIVSNFENIDIKGKLATDNLHLAQVLGSEMGLDNLSLNTQVGLHIAKNQPLAVTAENSNISVNYKGFHYSDLHFSGEYSGSNVKGHIVSNSPENKLDLTADIDFGNQMKFDVKGTIDKLMLSPLISVEKWKNPQLTARIDASVAGSSIDDLVGTVMIDSTSLSDEKFIYNPGIIYLQALAPDSIGEKKIRLFSSVLEGEITGNYHFSTIGNDLMTALHQHLPSLIEDPEKPLKKSKAQKEEKKINQFQVNLTLKNTEDLSYALSLPFVNVEPASINALINTAGVQPFFVNAHIPRLMLGQNDIRESLIDFIVNSQSGVSVVANTYLAQDDGHINAWLKTNALNDSVTNILSLVMDNNIGVADGALDVSMGFSRDELKNLVSNISINPTEMLFNDKKLKINPSTVVYEKDRIVVNNFEIRESGMLLLGVDGVASKNREDAIRAFFNNTELESILGAFNITGFKGFINGAVLVNQALADPIVQTDNFRIEDIKTDKYTIGTLVVEGDWDANKNGLSLLANLKNKGQNYLNIEGFVPTDDKNPMDVQLKMKQLPLAWVQPFAESAFRELSGTINSNINISGQTNAPITKGWIGIDDGVMTVAMTNATYRISDTINISPDKIGFERLVIKDENDHEAHLNFSLKHSNFNGMSYNATLQMNDFLLLNNENQTDQIAYGTLKLSGDININGSNAGIFGSANLRNVSRSNVMIELPQTAQAAEYSGVIYINTPQEEDPLPFLRKKENANSQTSTQLKSSMPINIQATINLNPMLNAGVVINPTTGDALQINGTGLIRAVVDSRSNPMVRLYGDYVAEEGKYHYNFKGLKTIDFNLREGSTVTLVGDPLNTQFNIVAYNQVNADLATLSEGFTTLLPNTRTQVNATLDIQGSLEQMNLKYGLELPEASDVVRQRFNSLVSTDEEKFRQFGLLVAVGSFFPADDSAMPTPGGNAFTSFAASKISQGLDAILAGALNKNWSVNTNIDSKDGTLESTRMGVDLSTRLLNDRLRITTNLSYGDKSTLASQQEFLGEFELEYDINNWLMIRGYSRPNERFSKRAPTTQGVGIVVTKDALRFKDLFKFSFRKKEE